MSGAAFTLTPNLGLFKPTLYDDSKWAQHWNTNADRIDAAWGGVSSGGPFLPLAGGTMQGPLNYTSTGGTVSRSAQDRAATFMTVEDFGAVGDGTTDDSNAFDAYTAYLRAQLAAGHSPGAWALGFGRRYYVSRSIDLTGFQHYRFECNHSVIIGGDFTHPSIDMLGSDNCILSNLRLYAGGPATPALVGILFGTYNDTIGHPNVTLENVEVDGQFSRACVQNSGSEVNLIFNCIFINRYAGGALGSNYALIQDGLHHWALNSRYITDARTRDSYYSFGGQEVIGGALQNVGNGSCLWHGGGFQHHYRNTYMQAVAAVPIAILAFSPDPTGSSMYDFNWDVHAETAPTALFSITGTTNVIISGFKLSDTGCAVAGTGAVFRAEADVSLVRITDADIFLTVWNNTGALLFNIPSKFTLNGRLMMLNQAFSHYNAPAQGFIDFRTDDRTGLSLGVYGTVADRLGGDARFSTALVTGAAFLTGPVSMSNTLTFGATAPAVLSYDGSGGITFLSPAGQPSRFIFQNGTTESFWIGAWPDNSFILADATTSANRMILTSTGQFTFNCTGLGFFNHSPSAKPTGYTTPTGTATRATFATGSVTLPVLAEHVKALIDDLTAYGLIGP